MYPRTRSHHKAKYLLGPASYDAHTFSSTKYRPLWREYPAHTATDTHITASCFLLPRRPTAQPALFFLLLPPPHPHFCFLSIPPPPPPVCVQAWTPQPPHMIRTRLSQCIRCKVTPYSSQSITHRARPPWRLGTDADVTDQSDRTLADGWWSLGRVTVPAGPNTRPTQRTFPTLIQPRHAPSCCPWPLDPLDPHLGRRAGKIGSAKTPGNPGQMSPCLHRVHADRP